MLGRYGIRARKVRDGAGHLQDPVVSSRAQAKPIGRRAKQMASGLVWSAQPRHRRASQIGVRPRRSNVSCQLPRARRRHAIAHDGRTLASLPWFVSGVLEIEIAGRNGQTPFMVVADWLAVAVSLVLVAVAAVFARRRARA